MGTKDLVSASRFIQSWLLSNPGRLDLEEALDLAAAIYDVGGDLSVLGDRWKGLLSIPA